MPRGKKVSKRVIAPDAKYNSELVAKFINFVMERGKKSVAQALVYGAIDTLGEIKKGDGLKFFEQAIEVVKPQVEVRSKRVGGANYQVPVPVQSYRQNALAFRHRETHPFHLRITFIPQSHGGGYSPGAQKGGMPVCIGFGIGHGAHLLRIRVE